MIELTGRLQYGMTNFKTSDINSIKKDYILVPQGNSPDEKIAQEAAGKLRDIINNPDKKVDIEFYSMLCDAVHKDYPNSPVEVLKDKADIPIKATHILGQYGQTFAVVPEVLASYEQVLERVVESKNESRIVDITG